jgi:hypothetical protein
MLKQYKKREDFAKDTAISAGIKWLEKNYKFEGGGTAVSRHIDGAGDFYYFYGLERAGILTDTSKIANRDWYKEGATWLLANQKLTGQWGVGSADTCFSILFLRRATEPLATH